MAFLDPYDLPPSLDDPEAFRAWLERQRVRRGETEPVVVPPVAQPEAARISPPPYSEDEEIRQTIEAMSKTHEELKPIFAHPKTELPPLSHEKIMAGEFRPTPPPDEAVTSVLAPFSVKQTPESKLIAGAAEDESLAGQVVKFAKPLLSWAAVEKAPAVPGFIAEPTKKFGELYEGKLPTHVYNEESGQVELSPSIQRLGAESALTAMTGGLVGTGAKAVVRGPKIENWIKENPRAKVEPISETTLGATGVLKKRTFPDKPSAYFHTRVKEEYKVNKEDIEVTYSIEKTPTGEFAHVDFNVLEPSKKIPGLSLLKRHAEPSATPTQGKDTLYTVAASVEKFVQQTKPERVTFLASEPRLESTYDAFARSLARKYDGVVVESHIEGTMATVEFPKNRGNLFNKDTLQVGLPELIPILTAPYVIAGAFKAARAWLPKTPIRTGELLDPNSVLGPPTLKTYDRPKDLVRAFTTGPVGAMLSYVRQLGYNNKAFYHRLEMNSGPAETIKVINAIDSGKMVTNAGKYEVPDGLSAARVTNGVRQLPKPMQVIANSYIHMHDILRRMNAAGVTQGAGMTIRQIQTNLRAFEQTFPGVKDIKIAHDKVVNETIRFAGDGVGSIFTPKQVREIQNKGYSFFIPSAVDPAAGVGARVSQKAHAFGSKSDVSPAMLDKKLGLTKSPREDAFDVLPVWVETILRQKVKNVNKMETIKAIESTGKDAIMKVAKTQKEVRKIKKDNPEWLPRMTMYRENGVPQWYISSQFVADMLRFDSHFATAPWLFATSRAFQMGTTGILRPEFALFQFGRETVLAPLSIPPGFKGIGKTPFTAVPRATLGLFEQIVRRQQKIFADELYRLQDSGSGGVLRAVLGDKGIRAWAEMLSKNYHNSWFHQWEHHGGGGISMAKNPISQVRSAVTEVTKNMSLPTHVRVMGETYMNIFDALQNASRYAFFKANAKSAKKAGKATQERMDAITRESRHLTGELMSSGQAYTSEGRLFAADYPKKWSNTPVPYYGRGIERMRNLTVWVNALLKGTERIGRAYWENPVQFTNYMYTGVFLPLTLTYFWAAARGPEYLDYLVNGRSEYDKGAGLYFPPLEEGKRPEEGWTLSLFPPEIQSLVYMYFNALHSVFGSEYGVAEGVAPLETQARNILKNQFGIVVPPIFGTIAATQGVKAPGDIVSLIEGEGYAQKEDKNSWLPGNTEAILKSIWGSTTDSFVATFNTLMDSGSVTAAMKEFFYQRKMSLPLHPVKAHNFTELSQDYHERLDKFRDMKDVWEAYGTRQGDITKEPHKNIVGYGPEMELIPEMRAKLTKKGKPYADGQMVPAAEKGGVVMRGLTNKYLGRNPVPPPTNPQYIEFAGRLHKTFDSKSNNYYIAVTRLSDATKQLQSLKKENAGTLDNVKKNIAELEDGSLTKSEMLQFDWTKRDSLRKAMNYYEAERRATYKIINRIVEEVEQDMGVKLDKLDPYALPETLHLGIGAP